MENKYIKTQGQHLIECYVQNRMDENLYRCTEEQIEGWIKEAKIRVDKLRKGSGDWHISSGATFTNSENY